MLTAKLAEVMAEVGYVQKDAVNDFHRYRYASAEAVLKKVNAALSERGIAVASKAELVRYDRVQSAKGEKAHAVVKLALTFHDSGADFITVEGLGSGEDSGDKAIMKANTAALKYAMANAFLISWGDDPEADPSTDAEPAIQEQLFYPEARALVASMAGKRGVKELRQFIGHCSVQGMSWDEVVGFAHGQGVELSDGISAVDCIKLRDMMKHKEA